MTINLSRRLMMKGALGASAAGLAACATNTTAAAPVAEVAPPPAAVVPECPVEAAGAFPQMASHEGYEFLGPQPGVALLSRNENPFGPSQKALKMIEYAATKGAYYAGAALQDLAKLIAERHGITSDMVAITTGSGEALSAIALIYGPKGPIVAPRLFWDTTALYAKNLGMATIQRVPLTQDMDIDLASIEAAVTEETGLVQLCNPNNPTGIVMGPEAIKPVVKRMSKKATVLVDEAYIELAADPEATTCIDLVKEGHDVIVSRTFSKIYGMAGIRVGYVIAAPETAQKIQATSMSWMAGTGVAAGVGAYNDFEFLEYSKSKIVEGREMVTAKLDELGMTYLPSSTNFVYFKSGRPANEIQKALAEKKVMIRGQYMDYEPWSRVSMGKLEDVERFCVGLEQVMNA